MLNNYFTQRRLDSIRGRWWSRFEPSGIPLAEAKKSADEDPPKFSAFVAAFLDLLLSILLFLGAVIACATSQFVKFFRLEPPCTYIGCTRLHAPRQTEPQAYCCHAKGGLCHDCFLFNTYGKFGLGHYVFTSKYAHDTAFARTYETAGASHFLREGSNSDELGAMDHARGDGGLRNQSWLDLDDTYFVCSNCDARLCGRMYRRRCVRRKVSHDVSQQAHCKAIDDTSDNIVVSYFELQDENITQHIVHGSNSDTDGSLTFSETSMQEEEESPTSPCLSGDLDVTGSIDRVRSTEKDALRNVDKRMGRRGQDDDGEELCINNHSIPNSLPDPLCEDSSLNSIYVTLGVDLSQHTLEGNQREVSNDGLVHMESYNEGDSVIPEQNESIKEDGDKSVHEGFLSEDEEERAGLVNCAETANQEEGIEVQEKMALEDSIYGNEETFGLLNCVGSCKQVEGLEATEKVADVEELVEASSSGEETLDKDLARVFQQRESTTLEFLPAAMQQLEQVLVTDSPEEQRFQEIEREISKQEAEQERSSEEIQKGEEFKHESSDVAETQVVITDSAKAFECEASFNDARSKATTDCLVGLVAISEPYLHDTRRLEDLNVLAEGISGAVQWESRESVSKQFVEHLEEAQEDVGYLQEGSNEVSEMLQIQDIKKRMETGGGHVSTKEPQEESFLTPVGVSQLDVGTVEGLKEEAHEIGRSASMLNPCEQNQQGKSSYDFSREIFTEDLSGVEHEQEMIDMEDVIEVGKVIASEDPSDGDQQENEHNDVSETDSEDGVDGLREALQEERNALSVIYAELEEERNAAAIAANEAMTMISRLQEEKAAMQMEAAQYQRMVEEKAIYDQQALTLLKEILLKREKEKYALEKEVDLYRERYLKKKIEEVKRERMGRRKDGFLRDSREPVLLLEGIKEENGLSLKQKPNDCCTDQMDSNVVDEEQKITSTNDEHIETFNELPLDESVKKPKADLSNKEHVTVAFRQAADERHSKMGDMERFERRSRDVLPRTHPVEHVETTVFSTEDEETRSILERLWFLEEQLKELGESEVLDSWKAGSDFQQLEALQHSPESYATWVRNPSMREQINGLFGDHNRKAANSSPRTLGTLRTEAEDNSSGSGVRRSSECNGDCSPEPANPWTMQMKEASSPSQHDDEAHTCGNGLLPVYDIYEVQHGSKESRNYAFEWEGKDYAEHTKDRLGKPDFSPGNTSKESSQSVEFARKRVPRRAKGRNLFCSHGMTSSGSNEKDDRDVWKSEDAPYPRDEFSLASLQQGFHTKSMVLRDERGTITEKEAQEFTARLQVLESDRDLLRQTLDSLKHKDAGVNLLQEITQHLRELKAADNKAPDTADCLQQQLEPLFNSSLEIHIPVIKKRRYTSKPEQTKQPVLLSEELRGARSSGSGYPLDRLHFPK